MKFTEASLEKTFTELLGQEGFPHHLGISITRKPDEVLIEEDLQNFLLTQYQSQGLTSSEAKSIILKLKSLSASDLYESNKAIMKMVADGFLLKREDRNQKDLYVQLIDYSALKFARSEALKELRPKVLTTSATTTPAWPRGRGANEASPRRDSPRARRGY